MQEIHALKEWQVAVDALERGEMILLLRKGGIREAGGRFAVQHDRVLLFPTREHQKPHLLKSPYDRQVMPVAPGWHPETVEIRVWADITDVLEVAQPDHLAALMPFHIWNEIFVTERLQWKSHQPLLLLLLRTYRLPSPITLPYDSSYGGCRSWIDVRQPIDLNGSMPVLSDAMYQAKVANVKQESQIAEKLCKKLI